MLNIFKLQTLYIRIFENKVEIKHIEKQEFITRESSKPFSNDRLLVASFSIVSDFIREIIQEIQGEKLFKSAFRILLQPMEKIGGGVSEVEIMIFNDLALHVGGRYVFIEPSKELLSDKKVLEITKNKRIR